jgi:hypothetical protein
MLKFLADPNLAPALIESANHYWSATLSQTIARTLSVTIAVLPRLAYSIDPSVLPDLEQWLEAHVGQTPAIDAPMKRTLRTLRFRARMRGELLHT